MKRRSFLPYFLIPAASFAVVISVASFINWELNPALWTELTRVLVVLFGSSLSVAGMGFYDERE